MTHHTNVRLTPGELALVERLRAALATPLRPRVTTADVLRAGITVLNERVGTQEARA